MIPSSNVPAVPHFASAAYALASVLAWGTSDFLGGYATRRANAFLFAVVFNIGGLALAATVAAAIHAPFPSTRTILWVLAITNAFNASQSKVHVTLVAQASYDDTWEKYEAGLSNGQLPDAVQLEDIRTQAAIDTQSFLPVQSCMNAAHYSTSDYLARPLDYWKVNGVQEALPFAVSAPILFYNQLAFTKAGLSPTAPPTTLS